MKNSEEPNLSTFTFLGLCVIIPVLILLFTWAVVPNKMPASRNLYWNSNK